MLLKAKNKFHQKKLSFFRLFLQERRVILLSFLFLVLSFFLYNALFLSQSEAHKDFSIKYPNYSWVYLQNSPDESANFLFSYALANNNILGYHSLVNNLFDEKIFHPRSTRVINEDYIIPSSFIGFDVLYGNLGKIFGLWIFPYITYIFLALSIFCFYFFIRSFFTNSVAVMSTILYGTFPAVLYWANRPFMHNILFLSLYIIGLSFIVLLNKIDKQEYKWFYSILCHLGAGIAFGFALATRTSEAVILVFSLLFFLFIFKKKWTNFIFQTAIIGGIMLLCMFPTFTFNFNHYGHIFALGYAADLGYLNQVFDFFEKPQPGVFLFFTKLFFAPFGFHFSTLWQNIQNYIFVYFWPYLIFFFIGIFSFLFGKQKKHISLSLHNERQKEWYFLLWFLTISALLILFYGSWEFFDNSAKKLSIGASHTRYWLILYVFALPFVALGLEFLQKNKYILFRYVFYGCITFLIVFSFRTVFYDPVDGLVLVDKALEDSYKKVDFILQNTSNNSVIAQISHDKHYSFARAVMPSLENVKLLPYVRKLLDNDIPVYWHYYKFDSDDFLLFQKRLQWYGLHIQEVPQNVFGPFEAFYIIERNISYEF